MRVTWRKFFKRLFTPSPDDMRFLHEFPILAFVFGAVNSIALQAVQVSEKKSANEAEQAFIAISVLFILASIALLVIKIIMIILLELKSKTKEWLHIVLVHILPSFLMFVFSVFYYMGDNLSNFTNTYGEDLGCVYSNGTYNSCAERAQTSSLWLLIIAVVGFQVIPILKRELVNTYDFVRKEIEDSPGIKKKFKQLKDNGEHAIEKFKQLKGDGEQAIEKLKQLKADGEQAIEKLKHATLKMTEGTKETNNPVSENKQDINPREGGTVTDTAEGETKQKDNPHDHEGGMVRDTDAMETQPGKQNRRNNEEESIEEINSQVIDRDNGSNSNEEETESNHQTNDKANENSGDALRSEADTSFNIANDSATQSIHSIEETENETDENIEDDQGYDILRIFYDISTLSLGSITTIDAVFSFFIQLQSNDHGIIRCDGLIVSYWVLYGFIMTYFFFHLLKRIHFINSIEHMHQKTTDYQKRLGCFMTAVILLMMLTVSAIYLIADNPQLLNCTLNECINDEGSNCGKRDEVELILLCVSFFLYTIPVFIILSVGVVLMKNFLEKT